MEDELEISKAYTPQEEEIKDKWIFPDSIGIPETLTFACESQKRSTNGIMIPCLKFRENTGRNWYLSLWSKPFVPIALMSGDTCKVYINKNKKLEVLKLN